MKNIRSSLEMPKGKRNRRNIFIVSEAWSSLVNSLCCRADIQYQTLQKFHTAQTLSLHVDMGKMEYVATMG